MNRTQVRQRELARCIDRQREDRRLDTVDGDHTIHLATALLHQRDDLAGLDRRASGTGRRCGGDARDDPRAAEHDL